MYFLLSIILLLNQGYKVLCSDLFSTLESRSPEEAEAFYREKWTEWKQAHEKISPLDNEIARYHEWVSNYIDVEDHNARYAQGKELYKKGMTKFADLRKDVLTVLLLTEVPIGNFYKEMSRVKLRSRVVPDEIDWAAEGLVSEKKYQPTHFSGWAFSAVAATEAQIFKNKRTQMKLSTQEIVDCVRSTRGRMFITLDAFSYISGVGVTLESFYPLRENPERDYCNRNADHLKITIKGYRILKPGNEENLKIAVALIGPISVSIKVTGNFFFYKSGVFYDPGCSKRLRTQYTMNHAVLLVGYGTDTVAGDYWVIQNNWGSDWGQNGFARMSRNAVIDCGIALAAVYPVL